MHTSTTEIYTLSLHDALPISLAAPDSRLVSSAWPASSEAVTRATCAVAVAMVRRNSSILRSEEHTSELQSHSDLVCRLLLEKKKKRKNNAIHTRVNDSLTEHY